MSRVPQTRKSHDFFAKTNGFKCDYSGKVIDDLGDIYQPSWGYNGNLMEYTLWLFSIAMENGPFLDDL